MDKKNERWWTPEQEEILKKSIGCTEQEWWTFLGLWESWRANPSYPETFCILRSDGQMLVHITMNARQLDMLIRILVGEKKHDEIVAYLRDLYSRHPEYSMIHNRLEYDPMIQENVVHDYKVAKEE